MQLFRWFRLGYRLHWPLFTIESSLDNAFYVIFYFSVFLQSYLLNSSEDWCFVLINTSLLRETELRLWFWRIRDTLLSLLQPLQSFYLASSDVSTYEPSSFPHVLKFAWSSRLIHILSLFNSRHLSFDHVHTCNAHRFLKDSPQLAGIYVLFRLSHFSCWLAHVPICSLTPHQRRAAVINSGEKKILSLSEHVLVHLHIFRHTPVHIGFQAKTL